MPSLANAGTQRAERLRGRLRADALVVGHGDGALAGLHLDGNDLLGEPAGGRGLGGEPVRNARRRPSLVLAGQAHRRAVLLGGLADRHLVECAHEGVLIEDVGGLDMPVLVALTAPMSTCGADVIDSMPPATTTSCCPLRIIWSAMATETSPDRQSLLIVTAGTDIGSPAAARPGAPGSGRRRPAAPVRRRPRRPGRRNAERSRAPRIATSPRSTADSGESSSSLPMGARAPSMTTDVVTEPSEVGGSQSNVSLVVMYTDVLLNAVEAPMTGPRTAVVTGGGTGIGGLRGRARRYLHPAGPRRPRPDRLEEVAAALRASTRAHRRHPLRRRRRRRGRRGLRRVGARLAAPASTSS